MKIKYNWGHLLTNIYAFFGFIVIFFSVVLGIIFFASAPRGMGYLSIFIVVAGSFQGALLLGIGSIGKAVLDGSEAQQNSLKFFSSIDDRLGMILEILNKTNLATDGKDAKRKKALNPQPTVGEVSPKSGKDDWANIV